MNSTARFGVLGLVCGLACGLAGGLLADEPAAPAKLAGVCFDCHGDIASSLAASAHGKAFAHSSAYAAASCESCHGDGRKHAESADPADILNPKKAKRAEKSAACLTCHENQKHTALWQGSDHESAGVSCVDCHTLHPADGGAAAGQVASAALCVTCHTDVKASLHQRSRHPIAEGQMSCSSCHNPHGTTNEHLVKGDSVNDQCLTCHQEFRAPVLWEHSPVREDCMTCHKPHGSNHDKLLVARVSQLCQTCHLQGRHQTVAGLDTSVWNSNRSCLNCHSQIHGSNHPSGPLFQR